MEDVWDLVPHLVVYRDTNTDTLYATRTCSLLQRHGLKGAKESTLADVLRRRYENTSPYRLCECPGCEPVVGKAWAWALEHLMDTHKLVETLGLTGTPEEVLYRYSQVRRTLYQDVWVEETLAGHYGPSPLEAVMRHLFAEVEAAYQLGLAHMRTRAWQDELEAPLHHEDKALRDLLKEANLGAPTDPGILIGERYPNDLHGVARTILAEVLAEEGHGDKLVILMPQGLVKFFIEEDGNTSGDGYIGDLRQLMALPEDLTYELLEMLVGTFDPRGYGPLSRLPEALDAARLLLTQG